MGKSEGIIKIYKEGNTEYNKYFEEKYINI